MTMIFCSSMKFFVTGIGCRTKTGIIWKEHANQKVKKISATCEEFYFTGLVADGSAWVSENYLSLAPALEQTFFKGSVAPGKLAVYFEAISIVNSAIVNHTKLLDCT